MKEQTYEEFMAEIDEMCQELMAEKARLKEEAEKAAKPTNSWQPKIWTPPYANQYEYLHSHELDYEVTESGARYDSCKWRYKECTEPAPWEKCWYEDWAN